MIPYDEFEGVQRSGVRDGIDCSVCGETGYPIDFRTGHAGAVQGTGNAL